MSELIRRVGALGLGPARVLVLRLDITPDMFGVRYRQAATLQDYVTAIREAAPDRVAALEEMDDAMELLHGAVQWRQRARVQAALNQRRGRQGSWREIVREPWFEEMREQERGRVDRVPLSSRLLSTSLDALEALEAAALQGESAAAQRDWEQATSLADTWRVLLPQRLADLLREVLADNTLAKATHWEGAANTAGWLSPVDEAAWAYPLFNTVPGYIQPAPHGLDLLWAWDQDDVKLSLAGADVSIVDLERDWATHDQLKWAGGTIDDSLITGRNGQGELVCDDCETSCSDTTTGDKVTLSGDHGSKVVGLLSAIQGGFGILGIAPEYSKLWLASYLPEPSTGLYAWTESDVAAAILDVLHKGLQSGFGAGNATFLAPGDVLLLEVQAVHCLSSGARLFPVEYLPVVADAIRLATALGLVVIEPAGNGGEDLDAPAFISFVDANYGWTDANISDTGAVVVGASEGPATGTGAGAKHKRLGASCYGSRVDCYAPGGQGEMVVPKSGGAAAAESEVLSTGTPNATSPLPASAITAFEGTSPASAIIAGAALLAQSVVKHHTGRAMTSRQLRVMFTSQGTASQGDAVGVMPDLKALLSGFTPVNADLVVRDNAADEGQVPSTGALFRSPDLALWTDTPTPSEQAALVAGHGTPTVAAGVDEVWFDKDAWVSVRVKNYGGTDATLVTASVYWSKPSTLVTPVDWALIDEVDFGTVASGAVEAGVAQWKVNAVKAQPLGHYCLVAVLDSAEDPSPLPNRGGDAVGFKAGFPSPADFATFVANNNNVAWRNFNVVEAPVAAASTELPLELRGWHTGEHEFELTVRHDLPPGATLNWLVPESVGDRVAQHNPGVRVQPTAGKGRVCLELPLRRSYTLRRVLLHAKEAADTELQVSGLSGFGGGGHQLRIAQCFEGRELGGLGWVLRPTGRRSPPKKQKKAPKK